MPLQELDIYEAYAFNTSSLSYPVWGECHVQSEL